MTPTTEGLTAALQSLVVRGDVSALTVEQRGAYYRQMCELLGLNPHAQPFQFLRLNGKEILYATRGATDQLAAMHRVNRELVDGPKVIDLAGTALVYAVCRASLPGGRFETSTATVALTDPVNALMRCETKVKRRATLALLGLALLDDPEPETATLTPPPEAATPSRVATVVAKSAPQKAEPEEPEGSRAFATYCTAIEGAASATAIRALYQTLVQGLAEERLDAAEFVSGEGGAADRADRRLAELGHQLASAELTQLLAQGAEGDQVARWLDAQAGAVKAPSLVVAAAWWIGHRAEIKAQGERVRSPVWYALARRAGGVTEISGPATKSASHALQAAVRKLEGPDGGGGSTAPSTQAEAQASPTSPAEASGHPAVAELRAHLRAHKTPGAVAGSWWKHRDEFEDCRAEAFAAVLDELTARGVAEPHSFLNGVGERNGVREAA